MGPGFKAGVMSSERGNMDWPEAWMDALGEAMFLCEGPRLVRANNLGRFMLGLEEGFDSIDLLGSRHFVWTEKDRAYFDLRWPSAFRIELDVEHSDGHRFHAKLKFSMSPAGQALLQITDITEQRFRQAALLDREAHYRKLTALAQEGIATVKDGVIVDANARFLSLVGVERPDQIIGDRIESLGFRKLGNLAPYPGSGVVDRAEMHFKNRQGRGLHMDVGKGRLEDGSEVWMLYDITDSKATQYDLIQARERFRLLIESAPIGIVIQQEGGIGFVNPAAELILSADEDEIEGRDLSEFVEEASAEEVKKRTAATKDGDTPDELQVEMTADGETRLVNLAWRLSIFNSRPAVQISMADVTAQSQLLGERVRAQVAEESNIQLTEEVDRHKRTQQQLQQTGARLKSIFESGDDFLIWTLLKDGSITSGNPNFTNWLRHAGAEGEEVTWADLLELASNSNGFDVPERFSQACAGHPQRFELGLKKTDETRWLQVFLNPIHSGDDSTPEISCIAYDITERKEIDRQIRGTLKEKEILLQEVHHRVKNNLQIINSILNLQKNFLDDEDAKVALSEIQGRISTMSIIHETLYRHTDVSSISFPEYLSRIAANIIQGYAADARIELKTNLEAVVAPLDQAIPCGLIVNEWVSNAMKHAFVGRKTGEITISMTSKPVIGEEKEELTLSVEDNGVGLAEGFDNEGSDSLGLYLVQALSEQLDAKVDYESGDGTRFCVSFRRDKSSVER